MFAKRCSLFGGVLSLIVLLLCGCLENEKQTKFKSQLPIDISVGGISGKLRSHRRVTGNRSGREIMGMWDFNGSDILVEYVIVDHKRGGTPCTKKDGRIHPSKNACFEAHKKSQLYKVEEKKKRFRVVAKTSP